MEHKNISRLLIAAGTLAVLGILFVFYASTPLRMLIGAQDAVATPWLYMAFKAVCGLPYLLALRHYFAICLRIGEDRSFCPENVQAMNRITCLLIISAVIWCIVLLAQISGLLKSLSIGMNFPAYVLICSETLAMMASLAVALVAKMMAHLVNRAVSLQEDSDLTI